MDQAHDSGEPQRAGSSWKLYSRLWSISHCSTLRVPNYSFSWQLAYYPVKPIVLPKGTKIECTAHFDNSPNNPNNPDAAKEVTWGDQSWDEMMIGFFDVAFDANMPLDKLFPEQKKGDKKASDH